MVQSPSWEASWFAASQEIPRVSRNPKVHYRTHKRPPPVSILGQLNSVHIPTSHLPEIRPNIIHPSTARSPLWSPSLRFPHQGPTHPLPSPIRATCPAHLILLHFITRTILGEQYKSFSSSLCNLLHSPVTSSLLGTLTVVRIKNIASQRSPSLTFNKTLILINKISKLKATFQEIYPQVLWELVAGPRSNWHKPHEIKPTRCTNFSNSFLE